MLRAFPFRTFDDISALGLEVVVEYSTCYRKRGPIDLADERLRGRRFIDVRFACTGLRNLGTAFPPRPCGGSDHISIRPGQSTPGARPPVPAACPAGKSRRPPGICRRVRRHQHDGHRRFMDWLDDAVGFGRHDRKQGVVADVGCLLGPSIASPRPPNLGEEEGLLVPPIAAMPPPIP